MRKYTQEEKQTAIARYAVSQEPVSDILADTGIPKAPSTVGLRLIVKPLLMTLHISVQPTFIG